MTPAKEDWSKCLPLTPRSATSSLKIKSLINEINRGLYWRGASSIIKIESEPNFAPLQGAELLLFGPPGGGSSEPRRHAHRSNIATRGHFVQKEAPCHASNPGGFK
jgi:hypothetical protein